MYPHRSFPNGNCSAVLCENALHHTAIPNTLESSTNPAIYVLVFIFISAILVAWWCWKRFFLAIVFSSYCACMLSSKYYFFDNCAIKGLLSWNLFLYLLIKLSFLNRKKYFFDDSFILFIYLTAVYCVFFYSNFVFDFDLCKSLENRELIVKSGTMSTTDDACCSSTFYEGISYEGSSQTFRFGCENSCCLLSQ